MKTAIDYIIGELLDNQTHQHDDYVTIDLSKDHLEYLINRAKEIEKEQIMDFAMKFMMQNRPIVSFYNETFKSE